MQAHFQANFLLWKNNSREHYTNITLAARRAIVLTVYFLLEYITFKEEPIVLRVLRMIQHREKCLCMNVFPCSLHALSPWEFFLALFNCNLHLSLMYGNLYIKEFKPPICSCTDSSIDIWMHLHRKHMEISLMIINVVPVYVGQSFPDQ